MKTNRQTLLFVILILFGFVSCINVGKQSSENIEEESNEPIYELNRTFLKDYMGNRVGADSKYKNKKFRINGLITDFSNFSGPTVHVYVVDVDGTALCHFDESKNEEIGELQRGEEIVIEGIFADMFTSINFHNCIIKEVIPAENTFN